MVKTVILESVSMLRTILVILFGPGAGVEGVRCGLHNVL